MVRLVFAPIPTCDERFARQYRYEPPPEFPLASPSAGIVHHLSGTWIYALPSILSLLSLLFPIREQLKENVPDRGMVVRTMSAPTETLYPPVDG